MAEKKKKKDETPEVTPEKESENEAEVQTKMDGDAGTDTGETVEKAAGDSEKYLRLLAEYDNFRKRSAKERENIYTDVRVDTVTKFLPVYDNLKRALETETADEAFKKGVEMTFNQLRDVFKKLGVEEIEAEGKTFDPTLHNAVMHVDDDAYGENVIVQELEKGFKLGDKVIRFSMVKVAN